MRWSSPEGAPDFQSPHIRLVIAQQLTDYPCAAIEDRLTFGGSIIETGTHSYAPRPQSGSTAG